MHKTKLTFATASSGTYQVEWCQWVRGVQQKEWLTVACAVAVAEGSWNEDQAAMVDAVHEYEIHNRMRW